MRQEELVWGSKNDGVDRREALPGEVVFASAEQQVQRSAELLGAGALLVTLPCPTAEARGRLGELLEELVERELARSGAPSPYLAAWSAMPEDADARLADQLFRARTVGATGLAIAMGSLSAIANPTLTPDDSTTLRWLAETSADAPLVLLVDDADLTLAGYAAPVPLVSLMSRPGRVIADDSETDDSETDDDLAIEVKVELIGDDATTNDTRVASIDAAEAILRTPSVAPDAISDAERAEAIAEADASVAEPEARALPEVRAKPDVVIEEALPEAIAPARPEPKPLARAREPRAASRKVSVGVPVSGPNDAWRSWAIALSAAKGAQPLAAFERLFAESYVPLSNAISGGLDDPRALRAYDEFRRSFERSYTDAFTSFGATNRRPRLVMDIYDIASKQARLSNARSAHIVVVDSMRYDLGCMVRDALGRESTGIATLTSEILLWSALPTTTMRQLETFARGMDALRAPAQQDEPSESLRGRAAEVVRRLRVGSRELHKLDLIPAMLETKAPEILGSLEPIAAATAEALARHISTLAPRTLVVLVGDHGFTLDRRGEVQTGGASPEEVLVPAYSWLIGDLH